MGVRYTCQGNCLGLIIYFIIAHNSNVQPLEKTKQKSSTCSTFAAFTPSKKYVLRNVYVKDDKDLLKIFFFSFNEERQSERVQVFYLESLCFPSGPHSEDSPACCKSAACKWSGGHACGPSGCCPLDLMIQPHPRTKSQRTVC